ncbi:hypothetical protein NP493_675g02005 [Ridgeia piscesae]|uniref:Uncharacterized protein n=1 Tax=Ridgeia piscesae TaxID=27915 RepID=A0AAD9KSS5_RIDPI|nr:hypothetical protein NP493_675g02005 [Ridgeia piscesae]
MARRTRVKHDAVFPRPDNQRLFIWARRLVGNNRGIIFVPLRYNCVTHTQGNHELSNLLGLLLRLLHLRYHGTLFQLLLVSDASNGTLFEFHFVSRQCTRLVGENVLDLSKLLVKV